MKLLPMASIASDGLLHGELRHGRYFYPGPPELAAQCDCNMSIHLPLWYLSRKLECLCIGGITNLHCGIGTIEFSVWLSRPLDQ